MLGLRRKDVDPALVVDLSGKISFSMVSLDCEFKNYASAVGQGEDDETTGINRPLKGFSREFDLIGYPLDNPTMCMR